MLYPTPSLTREKLVQNSIYGLYFLTEKKYIYYSYTLLPTINDSDARLQTSLFPSAATAIIILIRVYHRRMVVIRFYLSMSIKKDVWKINYRFFLFVHAAHAARRFGSFQTCSCCNGAQINEESRVRREQ